MLDAHGNPVLHQGQPLVVAWKSADDMDTMGWHTEAHIRSPGRMADVVEIEEGAEALKRLKPLENEMDDFFENALSLEKHGVSWPFMDAGDVIRAHKHFDKERWPGHPVAAVEKWFERAEAVWEAVKPKP